MQISLIDTKDLGQVTGVYTPGDIYELAASILESNWSPGTFREGRRTIKTFIKTSLFVIDIDEGCTIKEALDKFKEFSYIIGTSRSHQKKKNGVVADRFRVVLFLDKEIESDEDFKATFEYFRKQFPFIDESCKDASRFFYPCTQIIGVNLFGDTVPAQKASILDRKIDVDLSTVHEGKGELWKSTLKLLQFGAKAGHRHAELIKALGNLKEQGYTQDEATELLSDMASKAFDKGGWENPTLSKKDLREINDMYSRESKYEYSPSQEPEPVFLTSRELLSETFDYLSNKDKVRGEPTGLEGLDGLLGGGLRTGELTVLMAHAKTGKNALCHYLLHRFLQRKLSYGYASRELSPATEVIPNLVTIETGINSWNSEIDEDFKSKVTKLTDDWPLYFSPGYGYFPQEQLMEWFTVLKSIGVNYFLFDHFHYSLQKEDYETTSNQIKMLKTITKQLDIHILLIVQPRSMREGETLSMGTLRGGAAIGQALDNLLILERIKNVQQENISKLTLSDARHRLARTGHIYLQYDPISTTFQEVRKELIDTQVSDIENKQESFTKKYPAPFKSKFLD